MATRDELEAVVREQVARCVANALQAGVPSTGIMNRATEAILRKADEYGLAEFGVSAQRRRLALAEAVGDGSYGGIAGGS